MIVWELGSAYPVLVCGVDRLGALHLQPADVHALFLADHVLVEGVRGETARRPPGSIG